MEKKEKSFENILLEKSLEESPQGGDLAVEELRVIILGTKFQIPAESILGEFF